MMQGENDVVDTAYKMRRRSLTHRVPNGLRDHRCMCVGCVGISVPNSSTFQKLVLPVCELYAINIVSWPTNSTPRLDTTLRSGMLAEDMD
jgi:hypothetical protein